MPRAPRLTIMSLTTMSRAWGVAVEDITTTPSSARRRGPCASSTATCSTTTSSWTGREAGSRSIRRASWPRASSSSERRSAIRSGCRSCTRRRPSGPGPSASRSSWSWITRGCRNGPLRRRSCQRSGWSRTESRAPPVRRSWRRPEPRFPSQSERRSVAPNRVLVSKSPAPPPATTSGIETHLLSLRLDQRSTGVSPGRRTLP
jgi:hypothetical protein